MDTMIADALAALLADQCATDVVRSAEAGEPVEGLWRSIAQAGFPDALVDEAHGGAGLTIEAASECWVLAGRHALPLPLSETMFARALIASAGLVAPEAPIALGTGQRRQDGSVGCSNVVCARTASWVLVSLDNETRLLAVSEASTQSCAFELDLSLVWPAASWQGATRLPACIDTRLAQALILSLQLAGALDAVFQRTLAWANEREQFGKPIGKFQAIQHQLSLMAEDAFAARMAARIACLPPPAGARPEGSALAGPLAGLDPLRIAVAKARTSEAALQVAQIAHSVHGAIGFTREFDLQLLTRRLHAWRQAAGSESAWHDTLGRALLASSSSLSLDVLREATDVALPAH